MHPREYKIQQVFVVLDLVGASIMSECMGGNPEADRQKQAFMAAFQDVVSRRNGERWSAVDVGRLMDAFALRCSLWRENLASPIDATCARCALEAVPLHCRPCMSDGPGNGADILSCDDGGKR